MPIHAGSAGPRMQAVCAVHLDWLELCLGQRSYRAEYWRFLDRFKHLSRRTYPHWSGGSEKKGCQYILKVGVIMTTWRWYGMLTTR